MSLGGDMKLRSEDMTWREIDGDLVILDLRSSTYLTANASASILMKELTAERSSDQLAEALVSAFGIPTAQAARDVEAFVAALSTNGLLEHSAPVDLQDPPQSAAHVALMGGGR